MKPKRLRMSGKALMEAAVDVGRQKGYLVAHFTNVHDSRGFYRTAFAYDAKGFPDLIFVGRKMVAVEVKGDGDTLSEEQRGWLEAFAKAGVETLVLTSAAWRAGELEAIL